MKFDLAVTVREKSGKGAARQLRRSGKVPGVLYGQGECLLLTIEPEPLIKILKSQAGSTALITLTINGAKAKAKRTALLRDFPGGSSGRQRVACRSLRNLDGQADSCQGAGPCDRRYSGRRQGRRHPSLQYA